jgi:peptidoglycan/xylan/chitin deacetylase (PgdA/CDA1 family)/spore germination protein YaaH/GT2 family glycosyltransferase
LSGFVFHDPSGKRAKRAGFVYGVIGAVVFLLLAAFATTLAFAPQLPRFDFTSERPVASVHPEYRPHAKEPGWLKALRLRRAPPAPNAQGAHPLVIGFWGAGGAESRTSLREHVDQLDVFAPQWVNVTSAQGDVAPLGDPDDRTYVNAVLGNAKKRPAVIPFVVNTHPDAKDAAGEAASGFNGEIMDQVLVNRAARAKLVDAVVKLVDKNGWSGIGFDFEELTPRALADYPGFLKDVRAALAPSGRQVWAVIPFDDETWDARKIQQAADKVVLMGYDEHWQTAPDPGAIAGQGWYEENLERLTKQLDPSRAIVALGSYGYSWAVGQKAPADVKTFDDVMVDANDNEAKVVFDKQGLNPHITFVDEDTGANTDEWFLDAVTMFNERQVTDYWRPAGYALWRIGTEDPGVWTVLGAAYDAAGTENLHVLAPNGTPSFDGSGEVLKVTDTPRPGQRDITIDPKADLASDENYSVIPRGYIVRRRGFKPNEVALTFDDGPDPRWTPKLLDILKQYHAPATFFVIGENMQRNPELVKREVDEGHEVGSHTYTHPNIGTISPAMETLELTATQRLFQTITGKSLRLFRPPYLGDADPSTAAEVKPLLVAQNYGYVIAGLRIDPDDWKKPDANQIVQSVLTQLQITDDQYKGRVVLLHDSGGIRTETIKALPNLIQALRAHGYKLVTMGELAGMTPDQVMPPVDRDHQFGLALDRAAFFLGRNFEAGISFLMMTAIVLGIARLLFLGILSLVHRFRSPKHTPPELDPATGPLVSVLIPCFNEEKVIVQSVRRILDSHWTNLEVLVLDDGSKDRTSEVVEAAYGAEPRVRLMRFENGGKASALNKGLAQANGEIVIALDADTLFPPETVGLLARWFNDPKIGAVAGNALVGNRTNIVTRWQALEYVTAQNLERRSLAALGAVTVVPGAVGAWRRKALDELGGYPADTLAEDQDLTIAVQQAGWKVTFDPDARAFTESPDTINGLLKQRFRWSFGTLQCLFKHRQALLSRKTPALGFVALPQVWLFQIVLTVIAPLVDLAMVWSLISAYMASHSHPVEYDPDGLIRAIATWSAFVLLDLAAGMLGMAMERRAPWADLPWLPLQRFGYRQMMYYVVIRACSTAVKGQRVGWGKLERKATAAVMEGKRGAKKPKPA